MIHNSQIHTTPNKGKPDPFNQSELMRSFSGMMLTPVHITLEFSQRFSDIIFDNMRYFQIPFSKNENDQNLEDPFFETKKKCLPENIDHLPMEERSLIRMKNSYLITVPFTIEKRDGSSFADKTMNNLIVDDDDQLIQLLYAPSQSSQILDGQRLMQVIEYTLGSWTVARKFLAYV